MKILKTKKYEEMNHYEKEIVEFLQSRQNFTKDDAIDSIEKYYPIMERLGWNSTAEEWADNLNHIINEKKATPEEWNEFVNKYQKAVHVKPIDSKAIQKDFYIKTTEGELKQKIDDIPKELFEQFPPLKIFVEKIKEFFDSDLSTTEIEEIILESDEYQELVKFLVRIFNASEDYYTDN